MDGAGQIEAVGLDAEQAKATGYYLELRAQMQELFARGETTEIVPLEDGQDPLRGDENPFTVARRLRDARDAATQLEIDVDKLYMEQDAEAERNN